MERGIPARRAEGTRHGDGASRVHPQHEREKQYEEKEGPALRNEVILKTQASPVVTDLIGKRGGERTKEKTSRRPYQDAPVD